MIDQAKIETAALSIIEAIGDNPRRQGLVGTPQRIAEMYAELFSGLDMDAKAELAVGFEEGHHEMVILRDIPFYSMCEHHLLPFYNLAALLLVWIYITFFASKISTLVRTLNARGRKSTNMSFFAIYYCVHICVIGKTFLPL